MPCINLYPTASCVVCINNSQTEYRSFIRYEKVWNWVSRILLHFCTHSNEFNCVFRSEKLRKYAALSGAMNYMSDIFHNINLNMLHLYMNLQYLYEWICMYDGHWEITNTLTTLFSVEHKLVHKANIKASLNCMSVIMFKIWFRI